MPEQDDFLPAQFDMPPQPARVGCRDSTLNVCVS